MAAAPFFLSFFSFFLSLPLPLHDSRLFTCSPTSNRHARVGAYTQQSARFPFQNFTPRPFSPPRHRQFRTCNGRVACHSIAHACWNPHTHVRAARNQRDCVRAPLPPPPRSTIHQSRPGIFAPERGRIDARAPLMISPRDLSSNR